MTSLFHYFSSSLTLFPEAYAAGVLISSLTAVLGVFVVIKRIVFIGITLSEVAACGIAGAMMLNLPPYLGALVLCLAGVALLARNPEEKRIPREAVLGVLFVAAASLSILLVSGSGFGLHEVKALLYGDLILASPYDLVILAAALGPSLILLLLFFRPVLYSLFDPDGAASLGIKARFWETLFFLILGTAVSVAAKTGGAVLIFAYLVTGPSAALLLSRNLAVVLLLTLGFNNFITCGGLTLSFALDIPANQTIAVLGCALFLAAAGGRLIFPGNRLTIGKSRNNWNG